MAFKRITDLDDADRLAERVNIQSGRNIKDKRTAQLEIINYLTQDGAEITAKQKSILIPEVVQRLAQRNPELRADVQQSKFKRLKRIRKAKPQKTRVEIRGQSFLIEPPKEKKPKKIQSRKEFSNLGEVDGRTVFVKKVFVTVNGKRKVRYKSLNGKFAKKLT